MMISWRENRKFVELPEVTAAAYAKFAKFELRIWELLL